MAVLEIEIVPRAPFKAFLQSDSRWSCLVCHRRAGKTVACIQKLIKNAIECEKKQGRFAYIAPTYIQAKDVAWAYLKEYTYQIPGISVMESELSVTFPNGARIKLYGSDNYDRLRGLYLDGCVIDEAGDQHPRAWPEVIRPALADRQGWAVFIGTPKGKNGFHKIYRNAMESDDWFDFVLKASESGLVAQSELDDARKMLSPNQYEQEFECSFDAAIEGAYYASFLATAEKDKRIGVVPADPLMTYRAVWDIGGTGAKADATSIWICQWIGREIRFLDYYEAQGQPLSAHVSWLRESGYGAAHCILPHDGTTNDRVHDVSFDSALRDAGFEVEVIANQGKGAALKRVEAARRLFPAMWFNANTTEAGRDALGWYHEKRDEERNIGLGPEHDWSSHAADAFGLVAVAYDAPAKKQKTQFKRRKGIV